MWNEAVACYERALERYRRAGDRRGEALALNNLGAASYGMGDWDAALGWYQEALAILRGLDELRGKRLGCICAPHACHGDVLAELADFGETVLAEPATSPTIRGNGGASGHSRIVISQG